MTTALKQNTTKREVSEKGSWHLSGEQINFLLAEYGQFKRQIHIISDFEKNFNRTITGAALTAFQKKYANDIKQVRDQWVNALADEAGAHKRVRVVKLWNLYCNLEGDLEVIPRKIEAYRDAQRLKTNTIKQMESLLTSLRVEMEGNMLNVNYRNLSSQVDSDLIETARDVLNKVDPSLIEDADYDILGNEAK